MKLETFLCDLGFAKTHTEARRLLESGKMFVNGDPISNASDTYVPVVGDAVRQRGREGTVTISAVMIGNWGIETPPERTIDCLEAVHVNSKKLAAAAERWMKQHGKSAAEVIELLLNDVLGNQLVDDELEENIIVGLSNTYGLKVENIQHELNGDGDE